MTKRSGIPSHDGVMKSDLTLSFGLKGGRRNNLQDCATRGRSCRKALNRRVILLRHKMCFTWIGSRLSPEPNGRENMKRFITTILLGTALLLGVTTPASANFIYDYT